MSRTRQFLLFASAAVGIFVFVGMIYVWRIEISDLMFFYVGGKLFLENPSHSYDLEAHWKLQKEFAPMLPRGLPYGYPPFFNLLISPLSLMPLRAAYWVVIALNASCLVFTLILLVRRLALGATEVKSLVAITYCWIGVYFTILQGQVSFLLLLLLTLYVLDLIEGKQARAGMWAALLLFKPQFALIPLALLAWRRAWAGLICAGVVALALAVISVLLVGPTGIAGQFHVIERMMAGNLPGSDPVRMSNLRALVFFLLGPDSGVKIWLLLSALIVCLVLWLHRKIESKSPWLWSTTVLSIVLVTPHLHTHDLAVVVLPFALLLATLKDAPVPWLLLLTIGMNVLAVSGLNFPSESAVLVGLFLVCACFALMEMRRDIRPAVTPATYP